MLNLGRHMSVYDQVSPCVCWVKCFNDYQLHKNEKLCKFPLFNYINVVESNRVISNANVYLFNKME